MRKGGRVRESDRGGGKRRKRERERKGERERHVTGGLERDGE